MEGKGEGESGEGREEGDTHCKRTRGITGDSPAPATVERGAFLHEDTDDAAPAERLRVHLPLDLERVEGEQDDLADARQTARGAP